MARVGTYDDSGYNKIKTPDPLINLSVPLQSLQRVTRWVPCSSIDPARRLGYERARVRRRSIALQVAAQGETKTTYAHRLPHKRTLDGTSPAGAVLSLITVLVQAAGSLQP